MERPTGVRHVMVAVTTLVAVMLYLDRVCLSIVGEAIKKAGGTADWINLPDIGIKGNSHMLMQDRNSLQIADLLIDWIGKNVK